MSVYKRFAITTAVVSALFFSNRLLAEWHVSYERAKAAVKKQQWELAVAILNAAIAEKPESKANAKTYGLHFIDYFPYLYRGMALYHLGQYAQARQDLEKEERAGEVRNARDDRAAAGDLQRYLGLAKQRQLIAAKYDEALASFNQSQYEIAINKFDEVLALDRDHADAKKYRKIAEDEFNKLRVAKAEDEKKDRKKLEEERAKQAERAGIEATFNEGVKLFETAELNEAEAKLKAVLLREHAHAGADDYLRRIAAARAGAAKVFDDGKNFLQAQEWDKAEEAFLTAARLNKAEAARGRRYLDQIAAHRGATATRERAAQLLNESVALYNHGDLKAAKNKLLNVQRLDRANAPANDYLTKIAQAENVAREGIKAFFEGDYDDSIAKLSAAAQQYRVEASLQAILGCAYAAKYLLSGRAEQASYDHAAEKFARAKELDKNYKLDDRYISPAIIELFNAQ
ncbi:hypothetical protein L0337_45765 [candidate division KSB1 bacterium]|nr:hypothetical protein [candidate division KSB1 bacterium]